jgi:diguanylate cyclase (GGDEF)-like protein
MPLSKNNRLSAIALAAATLSFLALMVPPYASYISTISLVAAVGVSLTARSWQTVAESIIFGAVGTAFLFLGAEVAIAVTIVAGAVRWVSLPADTSGVGWKQLLTETAFTALTILALFVLSSLLIGDLEPIVERNDSASLVTLAAGFSAIASVPRIASLLIWGGWGPSALFRTTVVMIGSAVTAGLAIAAREAVDISSAAISVTVLAAIAFTARSISRRSAVFSRDALGHESERAKQAENQLRELQEYIAELEAASIRLQETHESFRHAAYHDALTGLPNRNFFLDTLKSLLESHDSNFAVLLLDLKSFKTINDSLGHSLGDRLIKHVGSRLADLVRDEDMVARFSGDKFGIILTDMLGRDEATAFADRLVKRLSEPYTLDGRQVFTSAKIGIAYGSSRYPEPEDLLRDADIAMYHAKDHEQNYVIFDQKMHIRAVTRLQLETDLRYAIDRKQFEVYYQPIIRLEDASLIGFEALVRWNHPQRGIVPPNEFIPIAESTGLIVPMTVQILHSSCSQVVAWHKMLNTDRPPSVAVNLSGKHFGHPALVQQINTVIEETGIDPASLKLELTESAVMENAETAILMLKQIKETGVKVSIDDFGTGYSSLSYLHRFPIDLLKVDRSFVSAMESNTENGEIVRTVIALAKALNLEVVAEGIESIHQFHQLRILGCEYGQGYLFSRPLPAHEIQKLIDDPNRWKNILPAQAAPPSAARDISHLRLAR